MVMFDPRIHVVVQGAAAFPALLRFWRSKLSAKFEKVEAGSGCAPPFGKDNAKDRPRSSCFGKAEASGHERLIYAETRFSA
jgi:hypothetical protein